MKKKKNIKTRILENILDKNKPDHMFSCNTDE